MALETLPRPQRSIFDRTLDLSRVNLEIIAYVVLITLSVVAHLWGLGAMALHHDESIHAWSSWKFYAGQGGFTCAFGNTADTYCYDPVYHGPTLYMFTALAYFLFGDGDAQARLPMAIAGIGLVASCWWLRPYLGRRGAFLAAVLLGFSPALLYYTRFARHDGLMVLWELWLVIGLFRYLDTGKPGFLYLLAAALALAIGTHELYYIVFFIFGILLLTRIISESVWAKHLNLGMAILTGVLAVVSFLTIIFYLPLPIGEGLYVGEKAFLVLTVLLLAWACSNVWDPTPIVIPRILHLWRNERMTLWIATGILVGLYLVMYTTFFAYPRGAIDGLYAGLAYWLGSQQAFARGDQPWYYYVMLLGIYEPLALITSLGAALYLFTRGFRLRLPGRAAANEPVPAESEGDMLADDSNGKTAPDAPRRRRTARSDSASKTTINLDADTLPTGERYALPDAATTLRVNAGGMPQYMPLFALVMVAWFFSALVMFSWAGEKMPWLVTHISLPGNLVAAWVLAQLLRTVPPLHLLSPTPQDGDDTGAAADSRPTGSLPAWQVLLVAPVLLLMIAALSVALARFYSDAGGQVGQSNLLQGFIPLLVFGGCVYALLTLTQQISVRVTLAVIGLTLAALTGAYMIRSTWLVVYTHPDVAIEPLIYTQTSPDVPRYVEYLRELSINQTRNFRKAEDVTGGLTMPIVISSSDSSGDGSLAWPMQWYLRDFQSLVWKSGEEIRTPSPTTFDVTLPDGSTGPAPVLMLFRSHVTNETRNIIEGQYVQPLGTGGVFNWWFPEGNKCDPDAQGYKRFYLNSWMTSNQIEESCGNLAADQLHGPLMPFIWPFLPANIGDTVNYMVFRTLPTPLQPGSRDMELWVRADLVAGAPAGTGGGAAAAAGGAPLLRLAAVQELGSPSEFNQPTGITIDRRGRVYVADTQNHRVHLYAANGNLIRTFGSQGSGENQFNEPRGLAVDADDNVYVADTWNARIVKISPDGEWLTTWGTGVQDLGGGRLATITDGTLEGNAANPLGFFGPRGLAVSSNGNIYIADTGNKRIIVTDANGTFLYQWGAQGSEPGRFNEPTGVAIDSLDRVYVADTWNGRVQVFETGADGRTSELPLATWSITGWNANTYDDPSIAVRPNGEVFVSVPARQHVLATTETGTPILRWGGAGNDQAALTSPSGLAVAPDGTVFVVDRNAGRVRGFVLPELVPVQTAQ
ncbi:MAG: TIGR03663 family protein [Chloroflexaceae bacterium]|nr:TIGR03663 family protein [Chloroflexaceae bacterium]